MLPRLFQDVYDHPRDDRRRLVLADALLEQGDVRGELIVLQFQTHATARKRAQKLIDRHRRHFLGPLSGAVLHGSDEWHKGFLVGCAARLLGVTADCPAWATVRRLTVVTGGARVPDELGSRWMTSLESVQVVSDHHNFWMRQHEASVLRRRAQEVLSRANRLALLQ